MRARRCAGCSGSPRYVRPYWRRAIRSASSRMLVATGAGLAGPYLAKLAIDDGIVPGDLTALTWIVAAFLAVVHDRLRRPGRRRPTWSAGSASAC